MSPSRQLQYAVTDEDLPADKFDKEFNEHLNINELNNVLDYEDYSDKIEKWVENFNSKLISYYLENWNKSTDNNFRDKLCRDFNYWLRDVIDKVKKKVKNTSKANDMVDKITERAKLIFTDDYVFKCPLDMRGTEEERYIKKELDNYCENRDSFENKLTSYDHTVCEKYKNYISYAKNKFIHFFSYRSIENRDYLKINENCNFDKRCGIFPQIQCDSNKNKVIREVLSSENELCVSSIKYSPPAPLQEGDQESTESSPSLKKILSVSTPVAGAIAFSVVLFKLAPVGSLLNRGRSNLNPLKDDFDQPETQDFLNSQDFLGTNPENSMYQIAYHTT
ncbi:PIR Superfamily Protein [Plasmodium ovale curtisi]|uniref:PIR Superfamily Protein n=1 Tax=Plasmodium ovale curtisi TaxID=864141 RepID=A0A1A8XAQ9_PLAOA|nr:PIR Superfamily Protein [Plasmodium ovale curtisi]